MVRREPGRLDRLAHIPSPQRTRMKPLNLDRVKLISVKSKEHKVQERSFGRPWKKGAPLSRFLKSLPEILAGKELREVVERIAQAVNGRRTVLLGMGAHPVKVGLNPILIDWMERGVLKGIGMNGAAMIHDVELAMIGRTSEEVEKELFRGTFGMVRETQETINRAIRRGTAQGQGIGEALGREILNGRFSHSRLSLLAAGQRLGIPVMVHVAIGTDITHMGPSADGAAIGQGSLQDFRTFAALVSQLDRGVFINLGSAVIMPEVFLKALALSRNLGHRLTDMTTVNMDFVSHYRPSMNVVKRPTLKGGKGYTLIGHHEIMFPLLAAAVVEKMRHSRGHTQDVR
jgi:hypothetical protein